MEILEKCEDLIPCSYERCFDFVFNQCDENLELFIATVLNINKESLKGKIRHVSNNAHIRSKTDKKRQMDFVYQIDNLRLNIELNLRPKIIKERNVEYICRTLVENVKKDEKYNKNYKTIQINVNRENIFDNNEIIDQVYLRNEEGRIYSEKIGIYLVNIVNLEKLWYSGSEQFEEKYNCLTSLFVKTKESYEKILKKEGIKNIMERIEEFSSDNEEWVTYRDENEYEKTYNLGLEMAKEEGLEEGKILGTNERNKEIALNMLKEDLSVEMISKVTNLTVEEINELKETL